MKDFKRNSKIIEFDKVLEMLASFTHTPLARERALSLTPFTYERKIERALDETDEAYDMSAHKGSPSFAGGYDVADSLSRAEKGAVLDGSELLRIASLLSCVRTLITYFDGDSEPYPVMADIFSRLSPDRTLENAIKRAIVSDELIADDASPALSDIRRKMRRLNTKIKDELQGYVKSGTHAKYLQDNIVTMRNGRYVIPVKSEYKNEVKGLIHETSSSGATMFIEPIAVVEANNELRLLEGQEKDEIERILAALTSQVLIISDRLISNYETASLIDFIFAKAELSYSMEGIRVPIKNERAVCFKKARHPLIDKKKVVPVDIAVGEGYDTLVITGPNTGGKTVALKTVGLFSAMVQSGLHVPCGVGSYTCVLSGVQADIGDEQSIEQSLSTFSAHMKRIVEILDMTDEGSLVLFDELGSGTDPVEGAALAVAVIERVRTLGAMCISTTHYSELKAYALETDGVCNASCEFDVATLRPTYRLVTGTPGKSNAFAISGRLGLDPAIIENARERVSGENKRFEDVIEKLEIARADMERAKSEAEEARAQALEYRISEEKRIKELTERTEREVARARAEAASVIKSAKAVSDSVLAELKELQRKRDSKNLAESLEKSRREIRAQFRRADTDIAPVYDEDEDYTPSRPIRTGDEVYIKSVGKRGTITHGPDAKGNVTVQTGMLTTRTNVDKLILAEDKKTPSSGKGTKKTAVRDSRPAAPEGFKLEIDLRGKNGDEAWYDVDKYLDDAIMSSVRQVTLVHGKGTGALRAYLQNMLRRDSRVKSFRNGKYGEGDAGVTVVELN